MSVRRAVSLLALTLVAACSSPAPEVAVDSSAMAAARADSMARALAAEAVELRDTAKATLATLLKDPATATWDSVVVVQPPEVDGRKPGLAVCGRIGGKPGIGGSRTPARFVYLTRFTVFVEEAKNREQFAQLWAKSCEGEVVAGDA